MGYVEINNQTYNIDGILFDKDGTLLEFGSLWVRWANDLIETLIHDANLKKDQKSTLSSSIGFDIEKENWDPKGPLCIGSLDDLITILSYRLYSSGVSWNDAVEIVTKACTKTEEKKGWENEIKPVIGLRNLLDDAKKSSLKLGVVTSDNYNQALKHLGALQIEQYFNSVIGHDQVVRGKPFPDMVVKACQQLEIDPARTIIIGDSNGDMILGKNSNVTASIGIVSEPKHSSDHLINADHIIRNYDEITIKG